MTHPLPPNCVGHFAADAGLLRQHNPATIVAQPLDRLIDQSCMRHIQGPFRFYGINRALEKYLRGVYRRFADGIGGGLFLAACGARFTRIGRRRTSSSRYAALATFSAATVQGLYRSAMMI